MSQANNAMKVTVIEGDLPDQDVDVIVNARNRNVIPWWLLLPRGVSGAIKKRGGTGPFKELRKHGPIPVGGAVLTSAGKLPFKGIIHVAGINMLWRASERSIRDSLTNALKLAAEHGFDPAKFMLQVRIDHPALGGQWQGRLIVVFLVFDYEQVIRSYAAPSIERYVPLDAKRPPRPCILLKPVRLPAEDGEDGSLPMLPARLCDDFPEITVPLEPYTNDFAGVLTQILRPNVYGYNLDAPDIGYIGGDPMLIQNPHDPICNECGKPMRFLFQFGEVVPGVQMADAGVFYVHGCDDHPDRCKGFVDSH